jgi:hypothetical protein
MEPHSYQTEITKMEDTLFKSFPSVKRVSVEVKTDYGTEINITLGDKNLFNSNESSRQSVANKAKAIVMHVFQKELPEKGKVLFVEEENTINVKNGSEKVVEIKFK